jgi:hypothetical protein
VRFEVLMAVKIQVEVFWVVMPCNAVIGYQHSEVHATSICGVKMEATWSSKTLVSYYNTT